jgi:hypothetical protein
MPSVELAAGLLRVRYPGGYAVQPVPGRSQQAGTNGARSSSGVGEEGPADAVSAALIEAFAAQGLDPVERFELVPASPADPSRREGLRPVRPGEGARKPGKVRIDLELPEDHDAVVLLEQDGFFSWRLPTGRDKASRASQAGRAAQAASHPRAETPQAAAGHTEVPGSRVVRFEIEVQPVASTRQGARTVVGRVRAHVLTFAAGLGPGAVMSFLERSTHPGLVLVSGQDVRSWQRVDNLAEVVTLPGDRPAKILLLVHGTFSNTVGSFGMLTATAEGQRLLKSAAGSYDAVIGFDHRTLSRDPLENAIDLQARLDPGHLAFTPTIDIISYSRGALVARSLIEYLLPSSTTSLDIGRVVFVAGTNAGTKLADPDNWDDFLDLYTNVAAAAARSVERLAGRSPADEIFRGLVTGIGPFVRFLVLVSAKHRLLPGLAAMEPDGPFITAINRTQPGQPVAGTPWYVVSSDFEVDVADDLPKPTVLPAADLQAGLPAEPQAGLPAELLADLPRELALRLADGLADRLMGTANDLVVDTPSMRSVDLPSGGGFIKETLSFGTNPVVHHLNYFTQPRVCDALRNWLT